MVWSDSPPTGPGYYWFKGTVNNQFLEQVVRISADRLILLGVQYSVTVDNAVGHWAGPIQRPAEIST